MPAMPPQGACTETKGNQMKSKRKKPETFPLADDLPSATIRAETVLEHYSKARGDSRGNWYDLVARAIADLAILADYEHGLSCAEARDSREQLPHGFDAEGICEEALEIVRAVFNDARLRRDDAEYGATISPPPIFAPAGK